jgi:hypothetical protein
MRYAKRTALVALLLVSSSFAVDQKSLLLGFALGVGSYAYQPTRNHVVLPAAHFIRRTVHPSREDKLNRWSRKLVKENKKSNGKAIR